MLRYIPRNVPSLWKASRTCLISRAFATRSEYSISEDQLKTARQWLSTFNLETLPRNICDISFSRSSGPGGQNVNKVNSKATLKVPLTSILRLVPEILHSTIRQSRFYNTASESITIQTDDSRKQSDNIEVCFRKLHDLVVEAAAKVIPGETTDEQRKRVKSYQKAANENRLVAKKMQSIKKIGRKGGTRGSSDNY